MNAKEVLRDVDERGVEPDMQAQRIRIGRRIREIREKVHWDAKTLAQNAKVDRGNLCRIEQGKYSVGLDTLSRIAQSLDMEVDFVDLKDQWRRNQRYREKYTAEASAVYINKMHRLDKEVDFRRDDSFHGIEARRHIIYKLGTLTSADGSLGYEFLIEYKITEPTVGIYYGCRGLIYDGDDEVGINRLDTEWSQLKDEVCRVLNNTFPDKDFQLRFKPTDNANDHTYWPFWITLNEDEDIVGVAGRATKLIRNIYRKELDLRDKDPVRTIADDLKHKTVTAFTWEAYKDSLVTLERIAKSDPGNKYELKALFDRFLKGAVKQRILYEDHRYELAWIVGMNEDKHFAFLIAEFFKEALKKGYLEDKERNNVYWKCFTNVVLNRMGEHFGNNLAKTYDNEKDRDQFKQYEQEAQKKLKQILELK